MTSSTSRAHPWQVELRSSNETRRAALRHYMIEVVRDLVTSGAISVGRGDRLEDVLRRELGRVLVEVQADFAAVSVEVGAGLLGGLEKMLFKKIGDLASRVGEVVRGGK